MPIDIFDIYDTEYDNWFEHHTFEFQTELNQIRQVTRDIPGFSLEVDVGSGRFASSRTIPYGVDPSRPLLRMARKRGIEVVQGRGEYLPFKPDSFRYAEMITVIRFLDNPLLTCAEIHRILVHDGILCIAFIEREGEIYKRYRDRQGEQVPITCTILYPGRGYQYPITIRFFSPFIRVYEGILCTYVSKCEVKHSAGITLGFSVPRDFFVHLPLVNNTERLIIKKGVDSIEKTAASAILHSFSNVAR